MAAETNQPESEERAAPLNLVDVLTEPDEVAVFAQLEELKLRIDADTKRFNELKEEAGPLIAVAGGMSGTYGQIVVQITDGGESKKFEADRLLTTPIVCPNCESRHFFPAHQVADLYSVTKRKGSVTVSIIGSRGGKHQSTGRTES